MAGCFFVSLTLSFYFSIIEHAFLFADPLLSLERACVVAALFLCSWLLTSYPQTVPDKR